jgi:hypothetical protein
MAKPGGDEWWSGVAVLYFVIAGLDPAIHAEEWLADIRRTVPVAALQYGPPGQARW